MGVADRQEMCAGQLPSWLQGTNQGTDSAPLFDAYLSYIKRYSCEVLGPKCSVDCSSDAIASATEAKLAYDNDYNSPEKYYPGIALMISGPMHVTSKKDKAFEETGLFEMALNFDSAANAEAIIEPINR
jgi:hypothetical protein